MYGKIKTFMNRERASFLKEAWRHDRLLCKLTCGTRSGVNSDAQSEHLVWTMTNCEARHFVDEIQSHTADDRLIECTGNES